MFLEFVNMFECNEFFLTFYEVNRVALNSLLRVFDVINFILQLFIMAVKHTSCLP